MADTRHKNANWPLPTNAAGNIETWQAVEIAVLMDLRDELQKLNRVFACPNFLSMPHEIRKLRQIVARLDKRLAKKKSLRPSASRR